MEASTLETRDLRLVRAIVEAGGATRAAKLLHLSQSAISHQLRGLEQRLGVELFRRDGRQLAITPAGEKLLELSHQVLAPLARAEFELRRGNFKQCPKLRLATQCYTAYHWLPRAFAALKAEHPEVELRLAVDVVDDAAQALASGELDLALCLRAPTNKRLAKVPLFEDELVLAVPFGHRLSRKKYVTGSDLAEETLIQINVASSERARVIKLVFGSEPSVARVLRVPATEAVLDLVRAGMGVSILARFTLAQHLARGDLEAVRLTKRGLPRRWVGVFDPRSPLTAPIHTLLDTLTRYGLPRGR